MTDEPAPATDRGPLTLAMLLTYRAYGGDIDAWARGRRDDTMTDEHWHLIEHLRQDLFLVAAGRASQELAAATERRLRQVTDSDLTREALRELARSPRV
jgi:hypothetical protein